MANTSCMRSAHKKDKLAGYRSFPELIEAYSTAVESLESIVKHTDGNDLGVGHPIEYLYAHLVLMPVAERARFIREMRRSYQTWLEQRELEAEGKPAADAPQPPNAAWDLDKGATNKDSDPPKVKHKPRRPGRK